MGVTAIWGALIDLVVALELKSGIASLSCPPTPFNESRAFSLGMNGESPPISVVELSENSDLSDLASSHEDDGASYESKLKKVLGSEADTDEADDDDEGEDAFGEFVYHGKDALVENGRDYSRQLAQVLGSTASDDAASSNGTPNGARELDRTVSGCIDDLEASLVESRGRP